MRFHKRDGFDGVNILTPDGKMIGQIRMPEIIGNTCFGGTKQNRMSMVANQALCSAFVESKGPHIT